MLSAHGLRSGPRTRRRWCAAPATASRIAPGDIGLRGPRHRSVARPAVTTVTSFCRLEADPRQRYVVHDDRVDAFAGELSAAALHAPPRAPPRTPRASGRRAPLRQRGEYVGGGLELDLETLSVLLRDLSAPGAPAGSPPTRRPSRARPPRANWRASRPRAPPRSPRRRTRTPAGMERTSAATSVTAAPRRAASCASGCPSGPRSGRRRSAPSRSARACRRPSRHAQAVERAARPARAQPRSRARISGGSASLPTPRLAARGQAPAPGGRARAALREGSRLRWVAGCW